MADSFFDGQTLDDVMKSVIEAILARGSWIQPSKGGCLELTGVLLEIVNPRARFSRTETKGKPFSSLGELCWYLAKTNDLGFISYYLPMYKKFADGNVIYGGYGPRFFSWGGIDQVAQIISLLGEKPDTRQAVIQIFDVADIVENHKDVPCTCTMQFLLRDKKLHMITYMRSNDAMWGLPHDIFCFTMLQEIIARSLSVELGYYKHAIGSVHIYDENKHEAEQFLQEGWQPTNMAMPPMPPGDPWPAIGLLLRAESDIRTTGTCSIPESAILDPYWSDLIRLLQIFRCSKDKNKMEGLELRSRMSSSVYNSFIDKRLNGF